MRDAVDEADIETDVLTATVAVSDAVNVLDVVFDKVAEKVSGLEAVAVSVGLSVPDASSFESECDGDVVIVVSVVGEEVRENTFDSVSDLL